MTAQTVAALPKRRFGMSRLAWREARWGYIFLAPWVIGFLAFTLIPMVATFVFTLTNVNLNQEEPLRSASTTGSGFWATSRRGSRSP